MVFATDLVAEYDAVAKPIDGRLVVAKRGFGKAITGDPPPIVFIMRKCVLLGILGIAPVVEQG